MYVEVCEVGGMDTSLVVFFIAGAKEEEVGTTFAAKMASGKEIAAFLAHEFEADRALLEFPDFLSGGAFDAQISNRHIPIILSSLTSRETLTRIDCRNSAQYGTLPWVCD